MTLKYPFVFVYDLSNSPRNSIKRRETEKLIILVQESVNTFGYEMRHVEDIFNTNADLTEARFKLPINF